MAKPRVVAGFDFDETLIKKDTQPDFVRFISSPQTFLVKSIVFLPDLVKFSLHRISNQVAKERLMTLFLRNLSEENFQTFCQQYADRLEKIANPQALERLDWHQSQGHETVIVSASVEDWIVPWAKRKAVSKVIATRLQRQGGRLTGRLNGSNCHGLEKAKRFLEIYPNRDQYTLYMYGDGKSDQAMFDLADNVYVKKFA